MGATRFPPIEPDAMSEAQRALADDIANGPRGGLAGPWTALLRSPAIGSRFQLLGEEIRFRATIAPALKELAVLLTARKWTSHFEWYMHRRLALEAGLPSALVDAIARGDMPAAMEPDQQAVHRFCTELLETGRVSDATFDHARALLGEAGVIELVCTVGYYSLVAFVVNVDRQPVPDDGFTLATS
jgi:4-carboxymuconolactone decarboxylase